MPNSYALQQLESTVKQCGYVPSNLTLGSSTSYAGASSFGSRRMSLGAEQIGIEVTDVPTGLRRHLNFRGVTVGASLEADPIGRITSLLSGRRNQSARVEALNEVADAIRPDIDISTTEDYSSGSRIWLPERRRASLRPENLAGYAVVIDFGAHIFRRASVTMVAFVSSRIQTSQIMEVLNFQRSPTDIIRQLNFRGVGFVEGASTTTNMGGDMSIGFHSVDIGHPPDMSAVQLALATGAGRGNSSGTGDFNAAAFASAFTDMTDYDRQLFNKLFFSPHPAAYDEIVMAFALHLESYLSNMPLNNGSLRDHITCDYLIRRRYLRILNVLGIPERGLRRAEFTAGRVAQRNLVNLELRHWPRDAIPASSLPRAL